jgi:hypothetical protein
MMTPHQAGAAAEAALVAYVTACGANEPDELRKVLEMMVSKGARGIEKYCGNQVAVDVLVRTTERLLVSPAPQKREQ